MTNDEIRGALIAACEGSAFVDVADEGTFILDGAFTLQQLVAIGDVARNALGLDPLSGRLVRVLDNIGQDCYFANGSVGRVTIVDGDVLRVNFAIPENPKPVGGDGAWFVNLANVEVIR